MENKIEAPKATLTLAGAMALLGGTHKVDRRGSNPVSITHMSKSEVKQKQKNKRKKKIQKQSRKSNR